MRNSSACLKYSWLGPTTNGAAWYPKVPKLHIQQVNKERSSYFLNIPSLFYTPKRGIFNYVYKKKPFSIPMYHLPQTLMFQNGTMKDFGYRETGCLDMVMEVG